jgi:hypothetical protein
MTGLWEAAVPPGRLGRQCLTPSSDIRLIEVLLEIVVGAKKKPSKSEGQWGALQRVELLTFFPAERRRNLGERRAVQFLFRHHRLTRRRDGNPFETEERAEILVGIRSKGKGGGETRCCNRTRRYRQPHNRVPR